MRRGAKPSSPPGAKTKGQRDDPAHPRWRASNLTENRTPRKEIRELKRIIAALKDSHKAMLRKELEPLVKRLAHLQNEEARKPR